MSEQAWHKRQESSDPHRVLSGAATAAGAQLPEVPLPVSAGAAQHRLGPAPLRDSGEDLVPEQTHQVEKGAAVAGEGGRGGAQLLHITLLIAPCCLLPFQLQSSVLSAAHAAPTAGALPPLLCVKCVKAQRLRTKTHCFYVDYGLLPGTKQTEFIIICNEMI